MNILGACYSMYGHTLRMARASAEVTKRLRG